MYDLIAARSQMAMSLGFHIIFAAIGIALPVMMVAAEWRWLRTGDEVALALAKRWARGSAILFAVGAVSGTVLSFELGLLWPGFMAWAGPIIGLPFSLEGFAFFTEAIFLGIYLYGWRLVSARAHLGAGIVVAVSGAASAVFVVAINAWMNTPTGFRLVDGRPVDIDPIAAMLNPSALHQIIHMLLAAYAATGLAVAGVHAWLLLRHPDQAFHRQAFTIAFVVGGVAAVLQPLSGDLIARSVAHHQPVKLAAAEAHFHTGPAAPFRLGGLPDPETETVPYALEIPAGLSLLLFYDPQAVVTGLDVVPREDRPPVAIVHLAFQVMVACGMMLAAVALWGGWLLWRGTVWRSRGFLRTAAAVTPLGFVAIEAGWVVTEVGRQPWIIAGVMRTADAVTPMPGLMIPLVTFTTLYLVLAGIVVVALRRHVMATRREEPLPTGRSSHGA